VAFARIELVQVGELTYDPAEALLQSFVPGTQVVRYDREWRMGRVERDGRWVSGRIGYQMSGSAVELWDDDAGDFRRSILPTGNTSPFVVDLEELRIAFQLRAGFIKPNTFTGNFRALLEEATNAYRWRIEHDVDSISWEEWRKRVSRITEVSVKLERPNPNYHGRNRVRNLIEGAGAKIVRLVYRADPNADEGLKVDAGLLAEALDHAEEHGSFEAKGELDKQGFVEPTQWREDVEGSPKKKSVQIDPATGEAPADQLRETLEEEQPPE
jgi:hypothetical protein